MPLSEEDVATLKEQQKTENKRRLAEKAREKAELAVCRRLELEGKLAADYFTHRFNNEPTPKRPCHKPASTVDSDDQIEPSTGGCLPQKQTMRSRICKLCSKTGKNEEMTQVQRNRHKLLCPHVPKLNVKNGDHVYLHKRCLAAIGLYPYPSQLNGKVGLARIINDTVADHIHSIIAAAPMNLGLQTLALYIYEELRKIIRPPTEASGLQMRKAVAYWVILHVPEDRFKFEGSAADVLPDELVELRLSKNQRQLCLLPFHSHYGSSLGL
jgi:hypothetical protein